MSGDSFHCRMHRSQWTGSLTLPELTFHSSDTGSVSLASLRLPAGMQVQCDVAIGTIQYDGWQLAAASLALEGDGNGWEVPRFRAETLRWAPQRRWVVDIPF